MLSRHTRGRENFFCLLSVLSFFASCFFSALIVTFFAYLIILYLIFLFLSVLLHPSSLHSFLCHILLFKKKIDLLKNIFRLYYFSVVLIPSLYLVPSCLRLQSLIFLFLSLKCNISLVITSSTLKPPPPIFFTFILLFSVTVSHRYFLTCHPLLLSCPASSIHLYLSLSEQLLASPLRVCELLGLNDFLLPPPVNSAPFDQANEIENFHLNQIDFKPEMACGQKKKKRKRRLREC